MPRNHSQGAQLSVATVFLTLTGAAGSVSLMLLAGRQNDSRFLLILFALWVLSPFAVIFLLARIMNRFSTLMRLAVAGLALVLAAGPPAIYANVAAAPLGSKVAFPFIVVPLGSWFLIATVMPIFALFSRRLSRFRLVRYMIRAVAVAALLLVLGPATLLALLLFDHNRDTVLPTPTGHFAVGRTTLLWADDRPAPLAPPGGKRQLLAWIWYPATPEVSKLAVNYLPASWRAAIENQSGVLLSQFLTRDLTRVRAHSFLDATVSSAQTAYPVVLMRGGGAALTTDYTTLAENLASHGYVVIGFDAPYRSWVVVLPDGHVIPRAPQNSLDSVDGPQADKLADALVRAWSSDSSFVLDRLEQLNRSDPSGRFIGRLDLRRVGMFGHSLGGATALQFCHDDARCGCGIDLDGAPLGTVVAEGINKPFMFVLGDHRGEVASSQTPESIRNAGANIQSIYDRLPADRRMMVRIVGANHYLFSDNGALLKSPLAMSVLRTLGVIKLDGRRQVALTSHAVVAFFDVYLKGKRADKLSTELECPEIEIGP
jgi:predicted dienelactone hydrolase